MFTFIETFNSSMRKLQPYLKYIHTFDEIQYCATLFLNELHPTRFRGDPEKCNYHLGQNALHLAASKGHLSCVTFLVGFDVNLWALDLDFLTAMQLAAIHGKSQVLQYLDKAAASQIMQNR